MTNNAIVVEGIKKRYDEVIALDGVDLEVEAGTVFGLLGPNGAGKTTMVRVLATVLDPDEGRAQVLGYDVIKQADAVRRRIGLAGQYAAVDANLTGRENLQMVGVLSQMQGSEIGPRASDGSTAIGPIAWLIPQRPTIARAIPVSCSMSDSAPVVIVP